MKKIQFYNLVIEITRKCNMCCKHCVRGPSQDRTMTKAVLEKLLEHTDNIGSLTISGGEPSLAIPEIDMLTELIKERGIPVYNIYCVTNGKVNAEELAIRMLRLYAYCQQYGDEPEMNGLALSKDMFHDAIPKENENILRGLAFFREDKITDFNKVPIISAGNARDIDMPKKTDHRAYVGSSTPEVTEQNGVYSIDDTITLTCDGDILQECDYAYDEIDEFKIGNVNHMDEFFQYLDNLIKGEN